MKRIFIVIAIILFSAILISCSSEQNIVKKEEEDKKQEQIEDLKERVEEFDEYSIACREISDRYADTINNLTDKFNNEKDNLDKKATYAELISEEYEKWFSDYSKISAPSFIKDAYNYRLEYLSKSKLSLKKFADRINYKRYDEPDDWEEFQSETTLLDTKYWNEVKIILKSFNKEAEELGLQKPYPSVD